jgi:hypothetical protein
MPDAYPFGRRMNPCRFQTTARLFPGIEMRDHSAPPPSDATTIMQHQAGHGTKYRSAPPRCPGRVRTSYRPKRSACEKPGYRYLNHNEEFPGFAGGSKKCDIRALICL